MTEYAHAVSGCAVKMLTRAGKNCLFSHDTTTPVCGSLDPATADEALVAIHRLRTGYVFVGLTDEWDMSICLLHKMLGGKCTAAEFVNSRSEFVNSRPDSGALYDTSDLNGFTDLYDSLLYEEATRIFNENKERYGVTNSTCYACFQEASVTHKHGI